MAEKLWFNPDEWTILHQAIGYLLSKETKELMKGFDIKNAENVPIGRLFSSVTKYLDLLDNVKKKWKDLNISDMSFRDSISLEGAKEFIGDKKIILEDIKSRYAWFSPTVLHTIHYGYSSRSIDEKVDFKAHEKTLNEDEKKFVTETLPNFGKNLPALVRSFSFWSPEASEAIEQFLNNNKLRYDDLIDIFVLSGWHASIDDMNAFEKSQVLVRIFLMIRKANGSEGYKFAGSIFQWIFSSDTKIKIPVEVKMVLSDFWDIFKEAMVITLKETRDMAFGIAKANPWFATWVWATVVWVLWLAIQLTPVWRVASTFMWLLTALGLGWVLTAYTMSSDGKLKDYSGKVVADVEKIADEHRKPKA